MARPDLTGVVDAPSPQWRGFVDEAVQAGEGRSDLVVVGHSGAGAMLPLIAERVGARLRAVIFVDAVVPPPEGAHTTSEQFLAFLDEKSERGRLPKWLDWWPPEVVNRLVPEAAARDELSADMPRLPRSFFDDAVPVPPDWSTGPCAYLKLSAAYDTEFADAGRLGWPRSSIDGTHLSIYTDPAAVLDAIEDLANRTAARP